MDITINVKLGKRMLVIPFTGGITSKNGVIPASYSTSNAIVQFAIEHSAHFKSGLVKLLKKIGSEEPKPVSLATVAAQTGTVKKETVEIPSTPTETQAKQEEGNETIDEDNGEQDNGEQDNGDSEGDAAPSSETDEATTTEEAAANTAGTTEEVTVSCIDDAREYLVEKFGVAPSKLRYKKNITDYAAEHGVTFVGLEE